MNITVIGTGFVGVVTAAVYAKLGHTVFGVDIDPAKVASLTAGKVPFFEPGLEELLLAGIRNGSVRFTTRYEEAIPNSDVIVVAVGTPSSPEGKADLRFVYSAIESLTPLLKQNAVVVIKSTVPPGLLPQLREKMLALTSVPFNLASMPEFLREGSAVADTLKPDRVVIGAENEMTAGILSELHKPLGAPIIITSPSSAQLGKYAANSYLALRIGFINQIADMCEKTGADIQEVISVIGADSRIGSHYWYPGLGFGGSCYPKDVRELSYSSRELGMGESLFVKLNELNQERGKLVFQRWTEKIGDWKNKRVAVLGLSFKPNTNDMREAPSLIIIPQLLAAGAYVKAYDPQAVVEAQAVLQSHERLTFTDSIADAVSDADVIISLIEWEHILRYDFGADSAAGAEKWFIDARNQFVPDQVRKWGFQYVGIGRNV